MFSVKDGLYCTDLVGYLITKGLSNTSAQIVVRSLFLHAEKVNKNLRELSDKELSKFNQYLNHELMMEFIDPIHSVYGKKSFGSTNPDLVRQAVKREEKWLSNFRPGS